MNKSLLREVDDLHEAGVIDEATASRIRTYFDGRKDSSANRLFVVFGVLGAILVGLGIILIIAHNWDDLSRPVKVFFSFLPLIAGQLACGYSLLKRPGSIAWKESSAAFLFFAVGASISLVSQVYHIHGELSTFLFTWMLLCLPLVYLLNSSVTSLLYVAGITYYQVASNYSFDIFNQAHHDSLNYWWMLALIVPHYFALYRRDAGSNYFIIHNWIVPLSLTIALGTLSHRSEELIYVAYLSLFAIFVMAGTSAVFNHTKRRVNGYLVIGTLGTMQILLMMSFSWYWEHLQRISFSANQFISSEGISAIILASIAALMLYNTQKGKSFREFHPMRAVFLAYIVIFLTGLGSEVVPVLLINLLILALGIFTIRLGSTHDHLGILNYGLLTITALIVCRFFDSDMSFVLRGLLFVAVGGGFFAANYLMLKKRKTLNP